MMTKTIRLTALLAALLLTAFAAGEAAAQKQKRERKPPQFRHIMYTVEGEVVECDLLNIYPKYYEIDVFDPDQRKRTIKVAREYVERIDAVAAGRLVAGGESARRKEETSAETGQPAGAERGMASPSGPTEVSGAVSAPATDAAPSSDHVAERPAEGSDMADRKPAVGADRAASAEGHASGGAPVPVTVAGVATVVWPHILTVEENGVVRDQECRLLERTDSHYMIEVPSADDPRGREIRLVPHGHVKGMRNRDE